MSALVPEESNPSTSAEVVSVREKLFFFTPEWSGKGDRPKRRFRTIYVEMGIGVNLIQTGEVNGHLLTGATPRWTPGKGTAHLKLWLRHHEDQIRIGKPLSKLPRRLADNPQRLLAEGAVTR